MTKKNTRTTEDGALGQIDPASVNYMDNSTAPNDFCAKCVFFMQPNRCTKIAGDINPHGWCQVYTDYDSYGGDDEVGPDGGPAKASAETTTTIVPVTVTVAATPAESVTMKTALLSESMDLSEARFEDNVLRNVVLIREGKSFNSRGYVYPASVLEKYAKVFEGAKAYNGHEKSHKSTDITGWYQGVHYEKGALRADRYFTRNQAGQDIKLIAEDIVAGRAPATLAGLSINADGKLRKADANGDSVVESITYAESVDDVANPARGGTYLAASGDSPLLTAVFNDMTYEEFLEARADYVERLRKDFKRIRQDDALKSADAETQRVQGELNEAQTENTQLRADHETALTQLSEARRALVIEQVLNDPKVKLPVSWRDPLRKQLQDSPPEQWGAIIESERLKAGSAAVRRVPVTGAEQQIASPVQEAAVTNAAPDWNLVLSSPAAFAAFQENIRSK